jgi:hypothetical protein
MNNVKNASIYNKELIMIMGTELVIMDALIHHIGEKLLSQYLFAL